MAYIGPEKVKAIRDELKKTFPEFKFSVRGDNYTAIRVAIMAGPVKFDPADHVQINHYHPDRYEHADILKKMIEIINRTNYDNSDIQTDYFDVGYYVTVEQGRWDRPYVLREGK